MEERMVTVNQVKRVVPIVEQLENYYAQIAQLDQRCEVIKAEKNQKIIRKKSRCNRIAIMFPAFLYLLTGFLFKGISSTGQMIAGAVGVVLSVVGYIFIAKPIIRRAQCSDDEIQQVAEIEEAMDEIRQEMEEYYSQNSDILASFPPDYQYTQAVYFFYKALVNGRADSLKEAINLYEDYLYKKDLAETMRERHEEQIAYLRQIENASNRAANNASDAAFWGAMNVLARS